MNRGNMPGTNADTLAEIMRARRTEKVLADADRPVSVPHELDARYHPLIMSSLRTAGYAPFHYPRNESGLAEPWRAHVLRHHEARKLARFFKHERHVTSKVPSLCAGCSALVLVTWLPEGLDANAEWSERFQRRNEEHLAATAAMVQNLLLLLTAHGMATYWSSGGQLRESEVFRRLGISSSERLLAAVFIEYPELRSEAQDRLGGKQREHRGQGWSRVASFAES